MTHHSISTEYLTLEEQEHVINALHFLRRKLDCWDAVAKLLHVNKNSLASVRAKEVSVTPNLTFRLAKVLDVGIDALLAETWHEPGMCPRCGYQTSAGKHT